MHHNRLNDMKKINTLIAVFLLIMVNGQKFKYGLTGNFHKGSIVGVHDVSKGAYGGSLGAFAQWSLVENDVLFGMVVYYTANRIQHAGGSSESRTRNLRRSKISS